MTGTSDDASLEAALAEVVGGFVIGPLPRPVSVNSVERLSAGASAQLRAFVAVDGHGVEHALIARTDGLSGGLAIGTVAEAEVLRALAMTDVPVPSVISVFEGHQVLGDGYVMRRLAGETLPRRLLRDEAYAVARTRVVADVARAAAAVHAAPVDALADVLPVQTATDQLALLAATTRASGQASPTFELTLRWLGERAPRAAGEPRLVHGDLRTGNLMVDADGLVALLDWELAHLGDPVEDLGWFCAPAWRFGGPGEAGGFGTVDALLTAYAEAGGTPVDPAALRWWTVLAVLKWGVICQVQAGRHLGGARSLEHAVIGRRVSECELDLLLLLDDLDDAEEGDR